LTWEAFSQGVDDLLRRSNCFEGMYKRRNNFVLGEYERQIFHCEIALLFCMNTKDVNVSLDPLNNYLGNNSALFDH
jgi:hypothetical protein